MNKAIHRPPLNTLLVGVLALSTLVVLALNVPTEAMLREYSAPLLIYGLLIAFMLQFGVILSQSSEISPVHVLGIAALLTLPHDAQPAALWAVFVGAVVGCVLLYFNPLGVRLRGRALTYTPFRLVLLVARLCIGLFIAGQVYITIGGRLPLQSLTLNDISLLVVFSLAYVLVYLAIFLLEVELEGHSARELVRANAAELLITLLVPVPIAVLSAEVYNTLSAVSFVITVTGLAVSLVGLHGITRTQQQLRQQVEELSWLGVMSRVMGANLDIDALLNNIYLQVSNLLDVDNFQVAFYNADEGRLRYPLVIQDGQPDRSQPDAPLLSNSLLEYVLQSQTPLLLNENVYQHARARGFIPPLGAVESWLGVPLLAGGRSLGALIVTSTDPRHRFTPNDLRLLNIVAANASVAIEHAQLYEQQTHRATQLATLNNVLALLTGTLSPELVLDTVISSASVISDATAVSVFLFRDDMPGTLQLERSAGFSERFSVESLLARDAREQRLSQLGPLVVKDVQQMEKAASLHRALALENKSSLIELPLVVGGTGLGVLALYFDMPQTFDTQTVEILRTFAGQAAQAIDNARQYTRADKMLERLVEQLFGLAAIGRQLTATMSLETIATLVLSYASDATRATSGGVVLRDEINGGWKVVSERGYLPGTFVNPVVIAQGITGRVLETGQTIRLEDVRNDADYMALMPMLRSQLTVPILREGETLGAVTLESTEPGAFSDEDTHFVSQLATQAVIAIENARLFNSVTEARDRLQVILDTMSEAIVLIDTHGRIALANPRVRMIGVMPDELLDHDIHQLLESPSLDLAERMGFASDQDVRKLFKEVRLSGYPMNREPETYSVQTDEGIRHVQRHVIPVRSVDSTIGVLLVFYDQTEEHELAQTRDDISRMIVHDLRSPLTAVTTSLRLLRDLTPPDSDVRSVVEATTEAGQRAIRKLLSRVDSLLDVSKMESGQFVLDTEPTELATLADNVCVELSPLAQELNITITSQISETLPRLDIDADKIERVLLNLVDNALKFSPMNSSIVIRTTPPGTHGTALNLVRIEVVDRGPGIPDEFKARLFDRYMQIQGRQGSRRGSGLGLTFCRLVIEAHSGRIWIEDNPDGGSVFVFTLPISDADTALDELESEVMSNE